MVGGLGFRSQIRGLPESSRRLWNREETIVRRQGLVTAMTDRLLYVSSPTLHLAEDKWSVHLNVGKSPDCILEAAFERYWDWFATNRVDRRSTAKNLHLSTYIESWSCKWWKSTPMTIRIVALPGLQTPPLRGLVSFVNLG